MRATSSAADVVRRRARAGAVVPVRGGGASVRPACGARRAARHAACAARLCLRGGVGPVVGGAQRRSIPSSGLVGRRCVCRPASGGARPAVREETYGDGRHPNAPRKAKKGRALTVQSAPARNFTPVLVGGGCTRRR